MIFSDGTAVSRPFNCRPLVLLMRLSTRSPDAAVSAAASGIEPLSTTGKRHPQRILTSPWGASDERRAPTLPAVAGPQRPNAIAKRACYLPPGLVWSRFGVPHASLAAAVGALALALWTGSALATDFNLYCSPTNTVVGDGSLANPYRSLAAINWATVTNQIATGNNVNINLQRGTLFREKWNLTPGVSGSSSARLAVRAYGSGPNPVIAGDDLVTGFAAYPPGAGSTWTSAISGPATLTFVDGSRVDPGLSTSSLANKQWFATNNTLFLRWDDGNPDLLGKVVEASVRDTCVYLNTSSNVDLMNVDMRRGSYYGLRLRAGANVSLAGCNLTQGFLLLDLDTFTNFIAKACRFADGWFGNDAVQVEGAGTSFAFWFCSFEHFPVSTEGTINVSGGTGGSFVNCTFANTKSYHLYNLSANATIWFANCVLSGIATGPSTGGPAVNNVAGTCNLTNCLVMFNGKTPSARLAGANEYGTVWGEPQYQHVRYPAVLSVCLDDYLTLSNFVELTSLMKTNYGWRASFACHLTSLIGTYGTADQLKRLFADGQDIISHSRWHTYLTESRAFYLLYTGMVSSATMTIANSNLTTYLNGNVDLSISLTNASFANYGGMGHLVGYLNNQTGYTCVAFPGANPALPAWLLTNVTGVNIRATPYTNWLDWTNLVSQEIFLSKSDLESTIGNGYVCKSFDYPGGCNNQTIRGVVTNAGYLSARGVNFPPTDSYLLATNSLFQMSIAPETKGIAMILNCQTNVSDYSGHGNGFTPTGIVYDSTHPFMLSFDAMFDGTSAYLSRPYNSSFDLSSGDWLFTCHLWPSALTNVHTLFFEGTDTNNYLRIYLNGAGALVVDARTNGASVVSFSSPLGALTNGGWQKVCVQQVYKTWTIRLNGSTVATTNSPAGLAAFGGTVYIGCGFNGSTTENYYAGGLEMVCVASQPYSRTLSMLDQMCEEGCVYVAYGHGASTAPLELWRAILDAVRDYSGGVMVMPQSDAANYIRTNGTLLADGATVVRTNALVASNDYNLRPTSPMRMAGLPSVLLGQTNLSDLNGLPITGPNGELLRGGVSLGAREYQPPPALPIQPNQTLAGLTSLVVTNTQIDPGVPLNAVTYSLIAGPFNASITANGVVLWTPLPSQVPSTNLFTAVATYYSSSGQALSATNSFLVIVNPIHTGPVLAAIANQIVYADSVLTVSNAVTDTDIPAHVLTFQLDPGAPAAAAINASNGVLVWPTSDPDANTTNLITVRVTDDGSPNLSDFKTFTATVVARPSLGALLLSNNAVLLTWSALSGTTYRVQYKAVLDATAWTDLQPDVTANGSSASLLDSTAAPSQRYYRMLVVP